jgi:hypothetical protein
VASTIPKVEVSNWAPVPRAADTLFTAALSHLDMRGQVPSAFAAHARHDRQGRGLGQRVGQRDARRPTGIA